METKLLTCDQLAIMVHMTVRGLRKAIAAGRLPIRHLRVGKRILFPVSSVESFFGQAGEVILPTRRPGRPRKK